MLTVEAQPQRIDVLIVTAVAAEHAAVLAVDPGAAEGSAWLERRASTGLRAVRARLWYVSAEAPMSVAEDLAQLEALDDEALLGVVREVVGDDAGDIEEIEALLEKHREGALADSEAERLDALRCAADRTMLRKARAAALLRFRGRPVPALAELLPRGNARG